MIYVALSGLLVVCFSSMGVRSFKTFSRHLLEQSCHERGASAERRFIAILKSYETAAVIAETLRILALFVTIAAGIVALLYEQPAKVIGWQEWASFFVAAVVTFLFADLWLPHSLSQLWGTPFVYYSWPIWRFLVIVFLPFVWVDQFVSTFFHRLADKEKEADDDAFEDEIRTIVTEGHREGLLEGEAREMIEGVIKLSDFDVSEIMTPRTDMVCLSRSLSWDEMLRAVIAIPHSRIPIFDQNRDDIVGVLYAKDLLNELAKETNRCPWTDLMKTPMFVPETKPVDTLLQEFQNTRPTPPENGKSDDPNIRTKTHLAVVLDEYGGVSGLVTLEDILEEIVGDIIDEHDPVIEAEDITQLGPQSYLALGKVRIDDINEVLHIELPEEEDYDTIAGFIFSTLGHVPEAGEIVVHEKDGKSIRFTVIEATRRRIEKIKIDS